MPSYVIVQLSPGTRSRSGGGHEAVLSRPDIEQLLSSHQAVILSAPDAAEDDASAFTTISVPDMPRARALAAALRDMDGIQTAFPKPGEELP